ncbi:MAG: histidine kinase [Candidatus Promineifilaceae bacterium]
MTTLSPSEKRDDYLDNPAAGHESGSLSRLPRWTARAMAILTMLMAVATTLLSLYYAATTADLGNLLSHQAMLPFSAVVYSLIGALIVSRRPRNPIGWIFLIVGLFEGISSISSGYMRFGRVLWPDGNFPGYDLAAWANLWIWMPAVFLPITLVLLLFPGGDLPSRRWRPVVWVTVLALIAVMAGRALHPGPLESWGNEINPFNFGISPAVLELTLHAGTLLLILAMIASIVALFGRFRRSRGVERAQIKWLVYACMIVALGFVITGLLWFGFPASAFIQELSIALTGGTVLAIAIAAGIAIIRYHLYDIDLIINRTLVYVAMTAVIIGLYALLVGGVGALLQTQSNWIVALVATVIVAILFQPLRDRLQRGVNRLLYGRRDEPFEVLADLGRRLEHTLSPERVYPALVETVAQTLKLPYAAIAVLADDGLETVVSYGRPVPDLSSFPLTYQGQTIGQLEVASRAPGESLSEADQRLLRNIAVQAGTAVHAVQLTDDLQRSRRRLVTAREEERRRLRRDLHDGLGPSLAALHLQAGVLRRLIDNDPRAAQALVDEFRGDIRQTIDEIRRVVYELRPPAIDQLGLVAAVRAQAARWSGETTAGQAQSRGAGQLTVTVTAPEALPPLPAAVEVAAYRIVQEALANVAHHAQATQCQVQLVVDGSSPAPRLQSGSSTCLRVEISDDGIGLNGYGRENGLGLLSMRERAEELGGECLVTFLPGGGTRVFALLPLPEGTNE